MSDENLLSKIELLEEQLENFERSGHFTEAEIDKYSKYLKAEIAAHKRLLSNKNYALETNEVIKAEMNTLKPLYGMSPEDYIEGMQYHNECFDQIAIENILNIKVINPEIVNQKAS